jgi:MFS family permease
MKAYIIEDIGGANAVSWLGTASTLATAAVAPFAGSLSDLLGRRYIALIGSAFIIIGMIVVGSAQRIEVAIGGTALVGVGGGVAELIGFAGIAELAPVRSRGKYLGTAFLFNLPFGAAQAYGMPLLILLKNPRSTLSLLPAFLSVMTDSPSQSIIFQYRSLTCSTTLFGKFNVALGSVDLRHPKFNQLRHALDLVSSSSSTQLARPYKTTDSLPN